ncbi:MAG: hypothetical protein AB7E24_25455 [Novosphingobium sp.]
MDELAKQAGLSMKTCYNLIGSKSRIIFNLLSSALDSIDKQASLLIDEADVLSVIQLSEIPISVFTSLPNFYRPLLRHLLGAENAEERPIFMERAYRFWLRCLLPYEKTMKEGLNSSALAMHLHTYFAGALDLWVQGEITPDEFRQHLRSAVSIALLPHARANDKAKLLAHIEQFNVFAKNYEEAMNDTPTGETESPTP